jgi:hypothetical protein
MDADFFRTLIDNVQPVIVGIQTDAREITEDWLRPKLPGGIQHVIMVVGYGEGSISPFTLKREPYFIVRDSLVQESIHYKMSVHDLLNNANSVYKALRVKRSYDWWKW